MDVVDLGSPLPLPAAVLLVVGGLLVAIGRRRDRGRNRRRYDATTAWVYACAYFSIAWSLAFVTGAVSTIADNPVVLPGQLSNAWWWAFTAAALAVVVVGYWVIWPMGTQAHGRRIVFPDTYVFGILWGVSEGMIFASVWTTAVRVFGRSDTWERLAVFAACYVALSLFIGLWHAVFWDIYIAPEHNVLAWNIRKVTFCHNPNVIVTTAYVTTFGNLAIYVGLQALALFGATLAMPFPSFRRTNPEVDPDVPAKRDMHGVVCVVTGIGTRAADDVATDLNELGARLVLVSTDRAAADVLAARLTRWTGAVPEVLAPVDLGAPAEADRVAAQVTARCGRADVLVDDATGVGADALVARHRGGVRLASLLTAGRSADDPLRVIVVGSEDHRRATDADLRALTEGGAGTVTTATVPATVAAARVAYALELARRSDPAAVVAHAVAPGAMVGGGSAAETDGGAATSFLSTIFQSNEDPARTYLHVASARSLAPGTGGYWTNSEPVPPSPMVEDDAVRDRVWAWGGSTS